MTNPILPVGARAYVNGRDDCVIVQVFPEGSTSLMSPHYCVRFIGGGSEQVKVSMDHVGVVKKEPDRRWSPLCDSCDLKRCPTPCASLVGEEG